MFVDGVYLVFRQGQKIFVLKCYVFGCDVCFFGMKLYDCVVVGVFVGFVFVDDVDFFVFQIEVDIVDCGLDLVQ